MIHILSIWMRSALSLNSIFWFPRIHWSRADPQRMIPVLREWIIATVFSPLPIHMTPCLSDLVSGIIVISHPFLWMNSIVRFSLARFFSLMEIPWRFHVTTFISLSGGNFLRSLRFVCLLMFLSFLFSSDLFVFPLLVGPGFGCTVSSFLAIIVPVWRALAETGPRGPSPSSLLKRCFGWLDHCHSVGFREVASLILTAPWKFLFRGPCVFFDAQDMLCAAHLRHVGGDTLRKFLSSLFSISLLSSLFSLFLSLSLSLSFFLYLSLSLSLSFFLSLSLTLTLSLFLSPISKPSIQKNNISTNLYNCQHQFCLKF